MESGGAGTSLSSSVPSAIMKVTAKGGRNSSNNIIKAPDALSPPLQASISLGIYSGTWLLIKTSLSSGSGVKPVLISGAFTSPTCSGTAIKLEQSRSDAAPMSAGKGAFIGCYRGRKNMLIFLS